MPACQHTALQAPCMPACQRTAPLPIACHQRQRAHMPCTTYLPEPLAMSTAMFIAFLVSGYARPSVPVTT